MTDSTSTSGQVASMSTTSASVDPVMIACVVDGTWAIWQVETDPDVQVGDFSGAWIIGQDGIQGFAADADWIEGRDDPLTMLKTVIRYPVLPVNAATRSALESAGFKDEEIIDWAAVQDNAHQWFDRARKDFSEEFPDKKQPSWGAPPEWEEAEVAPIPGLEGNAGAAARSALAFARALRGWIREWNAFDKVRVRRLGATMTLYSELSGLPFEAPVS
ncbi:N-acetylglucosamine-6-phosphate deacetylase [Corynebacterium sp. 321]|uniref:N-acetylglucosamine-6-phosphate deacetylase n=2 Tax=Corynebacteriaceae TaxID=1653 RepID=UPI001CE4731E|nr:N-acetylglucosamine-6-phosphate deacetylase [Corynebacterium sp. 321]